MLWQPVALVTSNSSGSVSTCEPPTIACRSVIGGIERLLVCDFAAILIRVGTRKLGSRTE